MRRSTSGISFRWPSTISRENEPTLLYHSGSASRSAPRASARWKKGSTPSLSAIAAFSTATPVEPLVVALQALEHVGDRLDHEPRPAALRRRTGAGRCPRRRRGRRSRRSTPRDRRRRRRAGGSAPRGGGAGATRRTGSGRCAGSQPPSRAAAPSYHWRRSSSETAGPRSRSSPHTRVSSSSGRTSTAHVSSSSSIVR